jgi:hypothetical protein
MTIQTQVLVQSEVYTFRPRVAGLDVDHRSIAALTGRGVYIQPSIQSVKLRKGPSALGSDLSCGFNSIRGTRFLTAETARHYTFDKAMAYHDNFRTRLDQWYSVAQGRASLPHARKHSRFILTTF